MEFGKWGRQEQKPDNEMNRSSLFHFFGQLRPRIRTVSILTWGTERVRQTRGDLRSDREDVGGALLGRGSVNLEGGRAMFRGCDGGAASCGLFVSRADVAAQLRVGCLALEQMFTMNKLPRQLGKSQWTNQLAFESVC